MNPIAKLFSRTPSASDIREQLKQLELDQKKRRRDLTMLEQKKQEKVHRSVEAKKANRQALLQDLFRETSQIEVEIGYANNDLRSISLSKTALTSFLRKLELLEQKKDRKGFQNLITRFKDSSIQRTIDQAAVDDDTFNDMLKDILEEEEGAVPRSRETDDRDFAEFERTVGSMVKTEEEAAHFRQEAKSASETDPDDMALVKHCEDRANGYEELAEETRSLIGLKIEALKKMQERQLKYALQLVTQDKTGAGQHGDLPTQAYGLERINDEYRCAHCGIRGVDESRRCSLCNNLLCADCPLTNCPIYYGKCAHCGRAFNWASPGKYPCGLCGVIHCFFPLDTCIAVHPAVLELYRERTNSTRLHPRPICEVRSRYNSRT